MLQLITATVVITKATAFKIKRIISLLSLFSFIASSFAYDYAKNGGGNGSNYFDNQFPIRHIYFTHNFQFIKRFIK